MEQKEEMKMKMGNMTCVLKELKIVDENMELDLENMLDDVKSMNIRDKWLEDKTIEDIRTCYAVRIFYLFKTNFKDSFISTNSFYDTENLNLDSSPSSPFM